MAGTKITGKDLIAFFDPETARKAQITVGAAISLVLVSAGVEGGIEFTIEFNLADIDDDEKVRIDEMAANIVANDYNPIAIFDVSGLAEFFMRAYVEITRCR